MTAFSKSIGSAQQEWKNCADMQNSIYKVFHYQKYDFNKFLSQFTTFENVPTAMTLHCFIPLSHMQFK
jgi:hypothetical protein